MNKNRHIIAPSVLSLLLILSLVWGYNQSQAKGNYEVALENHYQRLFFDVKKHVENVQVNLSKAIVADSKEQNIILFSQIMSEAFSAKDKLGQMPITHAESAKTEKFLTQAADYSAYLIQRHLEGQGITDDQRKALNGLQENSAQFNGELSKLHSTMMDSSFLIGKTSNRQTKKIQQANEKVFQTSLVTVDKQVGKAPELIYDGPFSDQMVNKKPVGLGDKKTTIDEAKKIATEFFGKDKVNEIEAFEEGENADQVKIPAYTFHLYPQNQQKDLAVYIGVSKTGGNVVWMVNPRPISKASITTDNAQERALKYLESKGFKNMEPNYSLKYDGSILFNFAYKQNDVTIYPDLIKVKVALDTGEIIGFDASAYFMNHQDRNIGSPHIDEATAREKVKTNFNIDSTRLAIIPKGANEILCYEFKGKYNDSDFIIYINSLDGREEQILQIIKDENGTLTF